jgi:hypothetical protein
MQLLIVDLPLANSSYLRLEKLPQMQNGNIQETKEDQPQSHGRINYYSTVNVNSFNVHNITTENCYNNAPVTGSSFLPLRL